MIGLVKKLFGLRYDPMVQGVSETAQVAVTRNELENLFAYELRVASADMSKLKVYGRSDRFKSEKIIPLDVAQHGPIQYEAVVV